MHSFIASIPEFFRAVWAYVVGLFLFYRKDASPDIEAGIVPLDVIQPSESVTVVEPGTDGLVSSPGRPPASDCTESHCDHTESACSDNTGRASRASAVDPVKSRIVDSTFNKVQDKTFSTALILLSAHNVVKSVVVTHNAVIVVPYSATIEYFDVSKDSAQTVPKRERTKRAANRDFKFDAVPGSSTRRYEKRGGNGGKNRRNSIDGLLEMFPLPPSHIPPLPPLPVATRELLDEVILKDSRRRRIFLPANRSSSTSSSESTTPSMFSGSASFDTTHTSPPSTPYFARSPFSPVQSTFAEMDAHEDDTCGFPAVPDTPTFGRSPFSPLEATFAETDGDYNFAQSPFSPVEPTFAESDGNEDDIYEAPVAPKVEILLWPAESMHEGELRRLREVDPFSLSVEYALALQEHAAADEDTAAVASKHYAASGSSSSSAVARKEHEKEDLTQYIYPEFFACASDYDALVKCHDRNVAAYACASFANLGGRVPEEQEFDRDSEDQPPVVRDMLDISPSEEAIVDSLLSQLETSFELDEKEDFSRRESGRAEWYPEQGFDREIGGRGYSGFSPVVAARALPSVAPLRIVKKNKPELVRPVVIERKEDAPLAHVQGKPDPAISSHWEENMANGLKAFREAEAEDEDFREIFYRDSSCFSESSCAVGNMGRGKRFSIGSVSSDGFYDEDRLRRLDQSFDSLERSMEQILADLDRMHDGDIALKGEKAVGVSRSGAGVVKDLGQHEEEEDTKDDDASSVSEYSDVNEDSGVDGIVPVTWDYSDDGEHAEDEDGRETSSGGGSDQWSDILELEEYSA
ncbi:hypothetical protein M413DRAFT_25752 [Hebeloma cylindrosporum]|uniref:Uncharacterized protein n=1 Tax=Hebeloma cylindrosporum TaxID=76867 RepID=A0A0C3CKL6_HEBCY|nr:hypothetical protein M413DRAFT_25752 [Hebeloma cylindrosporum h7]